ncbi:hypothetical protein VTL71DRAFT_9221 [Oculimacula yallundae]|uniref:Uncharacterized protein n=1 Tax=Oculimacula yallundae TaxID=86028 RepID=A0ABR4BSF8_9HELO
MPSSRRILTPLVAITTLILLSVLAVVSLGEGFKRFGVGKDGVKLRKKDTITFSMPWNPPLAPNPAAKAISPASADILNAVGKVAAALLGGGSDIADFAQSAADGLASTILAAAPSQLPSPIQNVNSAVDQATGLVGGIVSAATGIVGSLIAGTGSPGSPSAEVGGMNASTGGNVTAATTKVASTSGLNVSSSTSSMAFNITSAPTLNQSSAATASICASSPTCTACPAPRTETCTVTETWHSTHYESTATLFSFVAAFTYTCTETVSFCPKSSLYPLAPPNTSAAAPTHPPMVACPNGVLAKRAEDCPPTSIFNSSAPSLYPDKGGLIHPCPNAGYSCSECPDGVFCPPTPTSAQVCPCGWGWACGHCSQGWFCIPSPTSGSGGSLLSSSATTLGSSSASRITSSSVPSTMASFTANLPSLSSVVSALTTGMISGPLQAFPTSSGPLNQATNSAGGLAGNIINNVNSALGNIDGLSGAILNSVMGQLSSVLGSNFPLDNVAPTNLGAVTSAVGGLLPSVTGLAGGVISNGVAAVSNVAGGLVPTVTGIVGNIVDNVLPTLPGLGGSPATAGGIIPGLTGDLLPAGIPVATPAPIFQPTVSIPVINNVLPILVKAVQPPITRTVLPQPLASASTATSIQTSSTTSDIGPNIISHLTTTIQGTPTVLPVVITVLNGKPTVVPLVKMIIDGREKDLPVVGVDLGVLGKVEAVKDVLDGSGKRRRNRGRHEDGTRENDAVGT